MGTWLVPRSELTPEQIRAVELPTTAPRLILGGPGAGKTQVLVHRAAHLRESLGIDGQCFRLLVFTNTLKEYIRSALELLKLPASSVSTFDAWCAGLYTRYISRQLPWSPVTRRRDFDGIRDGVHERVTQADFGPLYDFVLVDEGQDLTAQAFDILNAIASHVTACVDHKQQLYGHGVDETEAAQHLGLERANATLLGTYRCSPYIVETASTLIAGSEEREAFRQQARAPQLERETCLLFEAETEEAEITRLEEVLRVRIAKGERVAILLPLKQQVSQFAARLSAGSIAVEQHQSWGSARNGVRFETTLPKVLTYHSAKGLTFDSVLMPQLVLGAFGSMPSQRIQQMVFVGVTRATGWAYLSTLRDKRLPLLDSLDEAVDKGALTTQSETSPWQRTNFPAPPGTGNDDVTDIF